MVAKLRLLFRLSARGVSQRRIAKQLNLSRTSVKVYLDRFAESGKTAQELLSMDDSSLIKLSSGETYKQKPDERLEQLAPLLEKYAKELKRRYVTIQLLWEEYSAEYKENAYSYTTFKHYLTEYINSHTYKYHNEHKPGDVLQVDFAGDKLYITDRKTGETSPVDILCCTLPCSGYSFVYALPDSTMDNLFPALSKCLEYIGGVPQRILSDNMKQWVKKREKNGPVFSDAAIEFGAHYNTIIEATKVRKPTHKASVEGVVHIAYQRIYAKIRNEVFFSLEDLNTKLMQLLGEFNSRKMKDKEYSREEFFALNEKEYLAPLPDTSFSLKYSKRCKVGSNYHVYVSTHQYSVPYEYVNKEVSIIYDNATVEIYDAEFNRIATHRRSYKRYGYTTISEHMPPNHRAYESSKECRNADYYLRRAEFMGESVKSIIDMVLKRNPIVEQTYHSCESILQLQHLDPDAFIKSCDYIIRKGLKVANYRIIRNVMETKMYLKNEDNSPDDDQTIHGNLRGRDAFLS